MKLQKSIVAGISALVFLSLSGCANAGSGDAPGADEESAAPVTVRAASVDSLTWTAWMDLPATASRPEDANVNIHMIPLKSSAEVVLAVQTGKIDMGPASTSVIAAALDSSDLPVKIVAGASPGTPEVVVGADSGITELKDLVGKKVGVVRGASEYYKLQFALSSIGIDMEKEVDVTTLLASTDLLLALQRGDLDAIVTFPPFSVKALNDGYGTPSPKLTEQIRDAGGVESVIIVNADFAKKNPQAVQAVINTYVDKWATFEKDPSAWVDSYLKHASGDKKELQESVDSLPMWGGQMHDDTIMEITKSLAGYKAIPSDTSEKMGALFDYSYLEKATGKSAADLGSSSGK